MKCDAYQNEQNVHNGKLFDFYFSSNTASFLHEEY